MEWLLGGAAVWLLFNAFGSSQRGGGKNGCPPGYAPQQTANGVQCMPTGTGTQSDGLSTQNVIQDVTSGVGILATGVSIAAGFIPHGAAAGGAGAGAAGGGGAATSGGGGGAASGGSAGATSGTTTGEVTADTVDAFATVVDASIAGSIAAAGFMVAAALAFVALGLALQSEGQQENAAFLRQVARGVFNRYTKRIFSAELSMFDSFLSNALSSTPPSINSRPPPYQNMNPVSAKLSARLPTSSSLLLPGLVGPAQQPMPSSSTPYGFTRCDMVNDLPSGCASSDPAVAAYVSQLDTASNPYFVNSVDPRLPTDLLMKTRSFYRWLQWTLYAQMNSCLASYYPYKDKYRGQGEDSSNYWLTPANFDSYASQFYQSLPAAMQPPTPVPWNDYPSLLSRASDYIALYNRANPTRQANFSAFVARVRFLGTVQAASEASLIGMGDNARQWTASWPGDAQFTALMMDALGLTAAGWTPVYMLAPNVGPNPILLGYDPASGCLFDFINAHNNPAQGVMYQLPPGGNITNNKMVIPVTGEQLLDIGSVYLSTVGKSLSGYSARPFAGFANLRPRGLKGMGRFAAIAPSWRNR